MLIYLQINRYKCGTDGGGRMFPGALSLPPPQNDT